MIFYIIILVLYHSNMPSNPSTQNERGRSMKEFYTNLTTSNTVDESRRLLETENHVESQSAKLNSIGEVIADEVSNLDRVTINLKSDAKNPNSLASISDSVNKLQSRIAENIQEYSATLAQLKTYNTRLNVQTTVNIPRVDIAVNKYNRIIADISAYTKGGSFRVDRQNVTNSAISRKSDVYIYAIWVLLTVIFAFLAVRVAYKGL
jgi:uncharacterized protein YydD (DUF2326 family)